jgi:hypothetical protein
MAEIGQMCSFSGCRKCERIVLRCGLAVPAADEAAIDAGAERLLDDRGDGARAAAAFGAATETAIDLLGVPGKLVRIVDGIADILVAQDVTGTNDHEKRQSFPTLLICSSSFGSDVRIEYSRQAGLRTSNPLHEHGRSLLERVAPCKRKNRLLKGFQIAAKL